MRLFSLSTFADNDSAFTSLHTTMQDLIKEVDTIVREGNEVFSAIMKDAWNNQVDGHLLNIPHKTEEDSISFTEYIKTFYPDYTSDVNLLNLLFIGGDTISACINITVHNLEFETTIKNIFTES